MADSKVTGLSAITTATTDDILYIVDNPLVTPVSNKITFDNLQKSITTVSTSLSGSVVSTAGVLSTTFESFGITVDGQSSVISTGTLSTAQIKYNCTIIDWTITSDVSGSIQFDIKKVAYASYPGSLVSIVASDPPLISSAQKNTGSSLTGWTTTITAGDIIQYSVTSAATITKATLTLKVRKT